MSTSSWHRALKVGVLTVAASSIGASCLLLDNFSDVHRSSGGAGASGPGSSNGTTGPSGPGASTGASSATGLSGHCVKSLGAGMIGDGPPNGTCEGSVEACGTCEDCSLDSPTHCGGTGGAGSCGTGCDTAACGCQGYCTGTSTGTGPACPCTPNGVCDFKRERCDCLDCASAPWCQ